MKYERIVAQGPLKLAALGGNFRATVQEAIAVLVTDGVDDDPLSVRTWVIIECDYDSQLVIEGADVFYRIGLLSGRGFVARSRPLEVHSAGIVEGLESMLSRIED